MNRTDVNKVEVNRVRVNMCTVNSFAARKAKGGTAMPVPIASYRCYDKTNDDEDRDILQDYSGNGHDIRLYNFAYAGMSGYGGYKVDNTTLFVLSSNRGTGSITHNKLIITSVIVDSNATIFTASYVSTIPAYKVKVTGIPLGRRVSYRYISNGLIKIFYIDKDGIYDIPESVESESKRYSGWAVDGLVDSCNIVIEQIPVYPGALVSDGVDDYGLCENFPIFTKEKGYTIIALREILQQQDESNHVFISNAESAQQSLSGAFVNERINSDNTYTIYSFGSTTSTGITVNKSISVNWQTSNMYNRYPINVGNISATSKLNIFSITKTTFTVSAALYALEIYDRDLTDEEIALVKTRMIREYEEGTGNKYEEEETI